MFSLLYSMKKCEISSVAETLVVYSLRPGPLEPASGELAIDQTPSDQIREFTILVAYINFTETYQILPRDRISETILSSRFQ